MESGQSIMEVVDETLQKFRVRKILITQLNYDAVGD